MTSYLGQLAENRLLNLRGDSILARRLIYYPPSGTPITPYWLSYWRDQMGLLHPDFTTLEAIRANPSSDEIADLGVIDAFYGNSHQIRDMEQQLEIPNIAPVVNRLSQAEIAGYFMCRIPQWVEKEGPFGSGFPEPGYTGPITAPSGDAFVCPDEPKLPFPFALRYSGIMPYRFFPKPANPHTLFWDRAIGTPWAELKPAIPNYIEVERVLEFYPFPEPFRRDYLFIYLNIAIEDLRAFANSPAPLNETVIRMWLTLSVLSNYERMANELQNYLDEQADNEKRNMIIRTAAIAVIGAVIGGALAASAVSTATSSMVAKGIAGISQEFSKERTAELSKDIEAASAAMASDNPEFAAEVKRTSDILKFLSEETQDLSKLPPDEQAKIAAGEGGPNVLAVAGIGGAALLLLYLAGAFD